MKVRVGVWRWGAAALASALAAACTNVGSQTDLRAHRIEQAVVPMARAALAAGQVETARRLYTRLLDVAPNAVDARIGLGDVSLAVGQPARAATWYLDAANVADDRAARHAALLAHGRASIDAGDLDGARRSFERLVNPTEQAHAANAAWAHNGLAVVAMLEGDPRGTVAAVERAVLLDPDEQRFRDNLARAVAIADAYRSQAEAQMTGTAETLLAQADSVGVPSSEKVAAAPAPAPGPEGVDAETPAVEVAGRATAGGTPGNDSPTPAADVDRPVRTAQVLPTPPGVETDVSGQDACPETQRSACDAAAPLPPSKRVLADAGTRATHDASLPLDDAARPEQPSAPAQDRHPAIVGFLVQGTDGDYLQVGAFAVAENARRLAERLPRITNLPVGIEPPGDQRPALYRVRIGPIPSRTGFPLLMQALRDRGTAPARRTASPPDAVYKPSATS